MEQLDFNQLMQLILTGVVLVQGLLLYRSVARETLNDYLKRSEEAAAKTPNKIDDALAGVQRRGAELLERSGLIKVTETQNANVIDPALKERIEEAVG